ncbi:MAG: hypothetical protein RLZZ126_939 [Pseudomonadota bacterium]
MDAIKGQRVLVLGSGVSGTAMAKWCIRCGATVSLLDTRSQHPGLKKIAEALPELKLVPHTPGTKLELSGFDRIYKSPGLSPDKTLELFDLSKDGVPIRGEIDLFVEALCWLKQVGEYSPQVLGVTGTNGKTTVTALTGHLLRGCGVAVAVAGNIGPGLMEGLMQCLDADALPEVWVLELSSFQLHDGSGLNPDAATVLNISQDHLDWHPDWDHYVASKARIFGPTTRRILNRDDPVTRKMGDPPSAGKSSPSREVSTFGASLPISPGDYGLEEAQGMVWLVRRLEADGSKKRRNQSEEEAPLQRLMPLDALHIRGRHNALNAQAALLLAASVGSPMAKLLHALSSYKGEPHRVELVKVVGEVEYFDDSKGTNVGATAAALQGLGADKRLVVIMGGDGKGQDFEPLSAPVSAYARAVILIGRDASKIEQAIRSTPAVIERCTTLEQAVSSAAMAARPGDVVLLSPACASFDMFRDYEHRAEVFRAAVARLEADDSASQVAGKS